MAAEQAWYGFNSKNVIIGGIYRPEDMIPDHFVLAPDLDQAHQIAITSPHVQDRDRYLLKCALRRVPDAHIPEIIQHIEAAGLTIEQVQKTGYFTRRLDEPVAY